MIGDDVATFDEMILPPRNDAIRRIFSPTRSDDLFPNTIGDARTSRSSLHLGHDVGSTMGMAVGEGGSYQVRGKIP